MPRRSRPANRRPSKHPSSSSFASTSVVPTKPKPGGPSRSHMKEEPQSKSSHPHSGVEDSSQADSQDSATSSEDEGEDLDIDAEPDAPRVAQWLDEEDLDEAPSEEDSEDQSSEEDDHDHLQADLKALPFGALRKAQKALAKARAYGDSGSEDSEDESGPNQEPTFARLDKGKDREEPREKKEVPKRKNKHAYTNGNVVEEASISVEVPRDPRFLPITGEYDPKRFRAQYGFLSEMHEGEMKTLKENLKRARKLLANSPRDLREEREAEVQRLERAVKRAESTVNKDRQEKVQMEALGKLAKEERERQKEGKKAWYMKNTDKKALLLRAKYDALAEQGGRGAVRKAIEKKQKKVNQKEKKKRPFVTRPPPRIAGDGAGPSRKRHHQGDGGARKRPRTS
ncbi:hypothetical protein C8Q79DRAFT_922543 [Trametes meyenii]|nr:hypothetical protein C8Q79DRAFT_922543 [Trametes meyenii]